VRRDGERHRRTRRRDEPRRQFAATTGHHWRGQRGRHKRARRSAAALCPHPPTDEKRNSRTLDAHTTRHPVYAISQRDRKRIEEVFGWMKTVGGLRKLRHRGGARGNWKFFFALAPSHVWG